MTSFIPIDSRAWIFIGSTVVALVVILALNAWEGRRLRRRRSAERAACPYAKELARLNAQYQDLRAGKPRPSAAEFLDTLDAFRIGGSSNCESVAVHNLTRYAPAMYYYPELREALLDRIVAPLFAWGMNGPEQVLGWVEEGYLKDVRGRAEELDPAGRHYLEQGLKLDTELMAKIFARHQAELEAEEKN